MYLEIILLGELAYRVYFIPFWFNFLIIIKQLVKNCIVIWVEYIPGERGQLGEDVPGKERI